MNYGMRWMSLLSVLGWKMLNRGYKETVNAEGMRRVIAYNTDQVFEWRRRVLSDPDLTPEGRKLILTRVGEMREMLREQADEWAKR